MLKKILLISFLLIITSCHKNNPVSSTDGNTQTNENKWITLANMNYARGFFCSAEANGKVYLFGGFTSPGISDVVEEFNLQTNVCRVKNNMPKKICGMAAAEVDGKIYIFGGRTDDVYYGTTLNYTYQYDPAADSWVRKKNMPSSRAYLTASVVNGKIYAIGGCTVGYTGSFVVQEYDPVSDEWTAKESLPIGTGFHTASVFNEKICIIGGGTSPSGGSTGTSSPYFLIYDPVNDSWISKADLDPSRWAHGSGIINNKLYVCGGISSYVQGGSDHFTLLHDLLEYDFSSDKWTTGTSMPSHLRAFQTYVYNNKLYIFGGLNGDPKGTHAALTSILQYIPPSASK